MKSNSRENCKDSNSKLKNNSLDKNLETLIKIYNKNKEKLENLKAIPRKEYKKDKSKIKLSKKDYKKKIKKNIIEISKIRNEIDKINNVSKNN